MLKDNAGDPDLVVKEVRSAVANKQQVIPFISSKVDISCLVSREVGGDGELLYPHREGKVRIPHSKPLHNSPVQGTVLGRIRHSLTLAFGSYL